MKTKLVIFGITGDLSTRKLLPALSRIIGTGEFDDLSIIGVSRRHVEQYALLGDHHEQLHGTTAMFTMDLTKPEEYDRLREYIDLQDDEQAIFYLSVPPSSSTQIVELLGQAGLNGDNVKLMLEKPFGTDLASAKAMIEHVSQYYQEAQVYRIDHYLAKEMAQNILIFRASNAIFNTIWDNRFIEHIEIVASEQLEIENRALFYEETGALRDVLQGHLMQLLALTIMDLPDTIHWSDMPAARLNAVNHILPADPALAVRGQYQGYADAVDNQQSSTETFVSVMLASDDEKWQGVTMRLATGKALKEKLTEVRVHFKKQRDTQANTLIFSIQPNEGVELDVYARRPGYDGGYELKKLRFDYTHDEKLPDAYEQVIVDAIRSHKSLFAGSDEVIRAWEILKPIQDAWMSSPELPKRYEKGSDIQNIVA
jgi:glucose-6-phosphate 1-dehydrogenase